MDNAICLLWVRVYLLDKLEQPCYKYKINTKTKKCLKNLEICFNLCAFLSNKEENGKGDKEKIEPKDHSFGMTVYWIFWIRGR